MKQWGNPHLSFSFFYLFEQKVNQYNISSTSCAKLLRELTKLKKKKRENNIRIYSPATKGKSLLDWVWL